MLQILLLIRGYYASTAWGSRPRLGPGLVWSNPDRILRQFGLTLTTTWCLRIRESIHHLGFLGRVLRTTLYFL
ncbi:hypothetical protein RHMOL_Rhmol12G0221500 [Rhododendron molle]|uniref:Uncharacterized protein n=1 Tax=Rhododendron molle TaxID=49168 RepID=A0ACC0LL73_RHOML|nr:hypothetical protein RHMOL_Rhmol12G0221500 [Rhododendron molle]